jgi:nucleotide-binding universal stress UspA family protein
MISLNKDRWSTPSTILLATEIPSDEKVFAFALAQCKLAGARLILFHAYDTLVVSASESSGVRYYDYAGAAKAEMRNLEPWAQKARETGVACEVVVHPGLAAEQILDCAHEKSADRIVMGTRAPGPISKILVGSVAEAVLRSAHVPVFIVGPQTVDQAYQGYKTRSVLCATGLHENAWAVVGLAADIAAKAHARLCLEHVIRQEERSSAAKFRAPSTIEMNLLDLIPEEYQNSLPVEAVVVPGDPTEEILHQTRMQQADLLVVGAQEASILSTLARQGVAYRLLGQAPCPVLVLPPTALERGPRKATTVTDSFMAGVI